MSKSSTRSARSALKSSRSTTLVKQKVKFNPLVRTLSPNEEKVRLDDIEKHHSENIRASKYHYKPAFKFATPYTTDVMGDNPTNKDVAWQTRDEYDNAKKEKQKEYIDAGYKWSVNAVNDLENTVTLCDLTNQKECETVSRSYFDGIPIVGNIYKKIRYILGRGGKRTKKRRRTNKKRKN